MAKYIYEKWNYRINYDALLVGSEEHLYQSSYAYKLLENGEFSGRGLFSNLAIGDYWTDSEMRANNYNNGTSDYTIFKKISSTRYKQTQKKWTKAEVLATAQGTTLVETLVAEEGAYPDSGVQDGFLYIKTKKAFPSLKINEQLIGGAKIKDSVGQMRNVGNVYFKDSAGVVRNLK